MSPQYIVRTLVGKKDEEFGELDPEELDENA
jgi:hypothetical protein